MSGGFRRDMAERAQQLFEAEQESERRNVSMALLRDLALASECYRPGSAQVPKERWRRTVPQMILADRWGT